MKLDVELQNNAIVQFQDPLNKQEINFKLFYDLFIFLF